MKKLFFVIVFFAAFAPLGVYVAVKRNLDHYDRLGKQFDCYPFETCRPDIDGDSRPDFVAVFDDPLLPGERLKVFLSKTNEKLEVLNIPFVSIEGSFRTHIAFFNEDGVSKATIYDTVNPHQHYIWNGEELAPNPNPSELESEIRTALGYNDDTGGFDWKIYFDLIFLTMAFVYYTFLFGSLAIMVFVRNRRKVTLA